jgi:hypothetical protein
VIAPEIKPGDRFGRWTVLAGPLRHHRRPHALVQCGCGLIGERRVDYLRSGRSPQCGRCGTTAPRPVRIPFNVGDRFGEWTVIDLPRRVPWTLCECSCGARHKVMRGNLRTGHSRRCVECSRAVSGAAATTHGMTGTPEHRAWAGMIARCTNPSGPAFAHYGGRGITVAPEWIGPGGFERFYAHVGPKPSPKHSIDRIDNDGGYRPGNVRWATQGQQMRNTRRSRLLPIGDRLVTGQEAGERLGISRQAIQQRLDRGWTRTEAATTPRGECPLRLMGDDGERRRAPRAAVASMCIEAGIEPTTIRDLAAKRGVTVSTVYRRVRDGWALLDALRPPASREPSGWERDREEGKYHCGACDGLGHNRRTCRAHPARSTEAA